MQMRFVILSLLNDYDDKCENKKWHYMGVYQ